MRRRQRGFSLLEMVVSVAIFGVILLVLTILEGEMKRFDRSMRLQLLNHPEPTAVLARVRRDVLDSRGYPGHYGRYEQSPSTLLLYGLDDTGQPETIVYDFSQPGVAIRMAFGVKGESSEWRANGVPRFTITDAAMPDGGIAVRVQARSKGKLIIDAIIQPRIHS